MKNITAGANPVQIRNGMNKTLREAVKTIKEISQAIESNEQIKEIANKGMTMIIVSHEMNFVKKCANKISNLKAE